MLEESVALVDGAQKAAIKLNSSDPSRLLTRLKIYKEGRISRPQTFKRSDGFQSDRII